MANVFDQFDEVTVSTEKTASPQNVFDQFDETIEETPAQAEVDAQPQISEEEAGARQLIKQGARAPDWLAESAPGALALGAKRGFESFGEGMYQRGLDIADVLGLDTSGLRKELSDRRAIEKERLDKISEEYPVLAATGEIAGSIASMPMSAGPGLASAAATGGLFGAGEYQEKEDYTPVDILKDAAIGATLGTALETVGKGVQAARKISKGAPTTEQEAIKEFAARENLPLMTTDLAKPQTSLGEVARRAGERMPFTGTGSARAAQQEAREGLVKRYADSMPEYNPDEVVKSLNRQKDKVRKAAGSVRQSVVDGMQGRSASPDKTASSISEEINRLTRTPSGEARKTADTQTAQKLSDYLEDIKADPSFENIQRLRTQFRTDVKGERTAMPDQSQAAINRIYKAMSEDMESAIGANLGKESLAKWRKSNAVYASEADKIKRSRLKNIFDKGELNPESVNSLLYGSSPSQTKLIYQSLDSKGKEMARAGLISKAMEKSGENPTRFLNELNKMSKNSGILFKGKDREYLDGMKKYLEATRRAQESSVATPTGQELAQAAPIVGAALTGASGLAGGALYGAMARAYESGPVRELVLKLRSTPKGTKEFERIVNAISTLTARGATSEATE